MPSKNKSCSAAGRARADNQDVRRTVYSGQNSAAKHRANPNQRQTLTNEWPVTARTNNRFGTSSQTKLHIMYWFPINARNRRKRSR
jgi:hypothetical protein